MALPVRKQYAGAAVSTTTTNALAPADTSVTLASTTGWPAAAVTPFYVVLSPGTSAEEKCRATISGSTLTLTRAQDGTTAQTHASGTTIYPVFTAVEADEANEIASKMTTKGDLLTTNGTDINRLAVGTNAHVLTADSTATNGVKWAAIPPDSTKVDKSTVDAKGDLLVGTANDVVGKLAAGTNEHRLVADSGETAGLKYVADTTNYAIAAKGDILAGTAADTLTAVTVGTNGQVLSADSGQTAGVKWVGPGTVGGLVLVKSQTIGSAVASVTVSDAFSADYDNYFITISDGVGSASTSTAMTLGATTTGYYYGAQWCTYGGVTGVYNGANVAAWSDIIFQSSNAINCHITLKNPYLAKRTFINYQTSGAATSGVNLKVEGGGYLDDNTSYTAFTLTTASGTLTGGTIRVYGYRN